jgi:hypothetical protein
MSEDRSQRMLFLQWRNAQLVFFRQWREKGFQEPEQRFAFLPFEEAEALVNRLIVTRRGKPAINTPTREEALSLAREWLQGHPGTVVCYVSNVGALVGDSNEFLLHFQFVQPLIESNLLFSTVSADSGYECGEFEHCYHPVIW